MDISGVDNFIDDAREKRLQEKLSLYFRVRSDSLGQDTVSKHKLSLKKKHSKPFWKAIRKSTQKPQTKSENNIIYRK